MVDKCEHDNRLDCTNLLDGNTTHYLCIDCGFDWYIPHVVIVALPPMNLELRELIDLWNRNSEVV